MPFGTDTVDGFIAHEVQEVVPEAVYGEKDAVDADGKIIPQSMDASKLIPLLTAAMQEQQALIQTLTARVEALEAK
jgi:predicted flavoprotein YhiN